MAEGDHVFRASGAWVDIHAELPKEVDPSLKPVVDAFARNHYRALSLMGVPAAAAFAGMRWKEAELRVIHRRLGRPFVRADDPPEKLDEIGPEIEREFDDRSALPGEAGSSGVVFIAINWNTIYSVLRRHLPPFGESGIDTFFQSQLVAVWTVFETVATDLWIEVVNARPGSLGKNAFYYKVKNPADGPNPTVEEAVGDRDQPSKGIPFHLLAGFGFDLSHSMGDYIKAATRKFDFNRLSGMHDAYRSAFGPTAYLDQIFRDAGPAGMRALEVLRNVIVHRGGEIDSRFQKQASEIPSLSSLKAGDTAPLDVSVIQSFTNSVVRIGSGLVKFADQWMKDNPV